MKQFFIMPLALLLLAGCAEYQTAYKAVEGQAIEATQNVNNDALDVWKKSSCALTYGAVMRDAQAKAILPVLCDPAQQPVIATPTVPAAAPATSVTTVPLS